MTQTLWPSPKEVHTIAFDFDGVFTDNKVYLSEDGKELARCDRADGLGIRMLRRYLERNELNTHLFILSMEKNPVVEQRARKLRLDCSQGVDCKLSFVSRYLADKTPNHHHPEKGFIYLGNDLNDLPVIEIAGFSVVPEDAHPLVQRRASVVLPKRGGDGFIREFVERYIGIQNLTGEGIRELILDR